ncbi:hypothetical protein [Demequina sp.]|uniref:hypothetical protein n=1 Tax=Demequina sp. TaxID=2050685 RepID=UPI003A85BED5
MSLAQVLWIAARTKLLQRLLAMSAVMLRLRPGHSKTCGVAPQPGRQVSLDRDDIRAFYSGRARCNAYNLCPRCCRGKLRALRREITTLFKDCLTLKRDTMMVSLSLGFPPNTSLATRWDLLQAVLESLSDDKSVRNARKAVGKERGYLKVTHLLHGDLGWHAHVHLIYILNRTITDEEAARLETAESLAWQRLAKSKGCIGYPPAQRHRLVDRTEKDAAATARYLTKALEEIEFGDAHVEKDRFACAADRGNRSAWQLIASAALAGDVAAEAPIREWSAVVSNPRTHNMFLRPTTLMERLHAAASAERNSRRRALRIAKEFDHNEGMAA